MSFDFNKALKKAEQEMKVEKSPLIGGVVLGGGQSGKSFLAGTFGVKTLFISGMEELHGYQSAKAAGGDIIHLNYEVDEAGDPLHPDTAYKNLLTILGSIDDIREAGFGAIVIDSATELESLFKRTTKWKSMCLSSSGKHNSFAETASTVEMFKEVINRLKTLQTKIGIHWLLTCLLDVKDIDTETGEIYESTPRLFGYSVAEAVLCQAPDVLVIGKMFKDEKVAWRLQFGAAMTKVSKDANNRIKKTVSYSPRLCGLAANDVPQSLPGDLNKLVAFKGKVLSGNKK